MSLVPSVSDETKRYFGALLQSAAAIRRDGGITRVPDMPANVDQTALASIFAAADEQLKSANEQVRVLKSLHEAANANA